MKMSLLFVFATATISIQAHGDIVKCTSTLEDKRQDLVVFIQRSGATGKVDSRPTNDVVLVRSRGAGQQGLTLGHFKSDGTVNEVGYDVDEGVRLFSSAAVARDQDAPGRIVMGRKFRNLDDIHIYWPQRSDFQTAVRFQTQIRADVKAAAKEYNANLAAADDAPVGVGKKNVEPTAYTLHCRKVNSDQLPNGKVDANGNFTDLEDIHDWALDHTN